MYAVELKYRLLSHLLLITVMWGMLSDMRSSGRLFVVRWALNRS